MDGSTTFWGKARVATRVPPSSFGYVESKISESGLPIPGYPDKMISRGGEDVVIYVIETTVKLKGQTTPIGPFLEVDVYYSSTKLPIGAHIVPPELDIEEDRLEVLWPIIKDNECPGFSVSESNITNPETLHGNITANIAGGTKYGAAPKARIVIVNKIVPNRGASERRKGSTQTLFNLAKPPIWCRQRIPGKLEAGLVFVSAAGNRPDNNGNKERLITKEMRKNYISNVITWKTSKDENSKAEAFEYLQKSNCKLPAAHEKVISVGAHEGNDSICPDFLYGDAIDIYAPGVDIPYLDSSGAIRVTYKDGNNKIRRLQGTSYASPLVAGTIAFYLAENPTTSTSEIKAKVLALSRVHTEKDPQTGQDANYPYFCIAPPV
ncbi:peptidase S8/S53 domain-containing protein [Phaeosphaeriaceae sp. PMI808]|nr:peptidase S8/S53 domain-containing protein [Phaeosphaeriaceae sp. PMI808]